MLGAAIQSELDAHELLRRGLPRAALSSLVDKLHVISFDEATEALGMSLRTLQRHKNTPSAPLDVQQSGRAWKFAEILAKATHVPDVASRHRGLKFSGPSKPRAAPIQVGVTAPS
jgi:putative toxin-antitoxin system antitoxin component (TIGR02293 family)